MDQNELLQIIEKAAKQKSTSLDLVSKGITSLPAEIGKLTNLTELRLYDNKLTSIPVELGKLKNLKWLILFGNQLTRIPAELGQLTNLKELDLAGNQLTSIPTELGKLPNLMLLELNNNRLTTVPAELGNLANLTELNLFNNQLNSLPSELSQLKNLTRLTLYSNQLTSVPPELGMLTKLRFLSLDDNKALKSPPPEVVKHGTKSILAYLRRQMKNHTTVRHKSISDRKKEKDKIGTLNTTMNPKEIVTEFEKRLECKLGRTSRRIIQEAWKMANGASPKSPRFTTGWLLLAIVVCGKRAKIRNTAKFLYKRVKDKERDVRESYREAVRKADSISQFNTEYVSGMVKRAKQIAIETTGKETISTRHLFAGLLLYSPKRRMTGAHKRLKEMGADIDELRAEFLNFLKEAQLKDDIATWARILKSQMELEEIDDEEASQVVAFLPSHVRDQASLEDLLGFEPYVKAISDFLRHKETEPPLTLSIEGEWGCGKSSFMLQVENEIRGRPEQKKNFVGSFLETLRKAAREPISFSGITWKVKEQNRKAMAYIMKRIRGPRNADEFTMRFNAWRHDKEDAIWAAFALEFLEQISRQRCWLGQWIAYIKLCKARYNWKEGWFAAIRFIATWLFVISLSLSILIVIGKEGPLAIKVFAEALTESDLWQGVLEAVLGGGGFAASLAGIGLLLSKSKDYVGNPLSLELRKYVQAPTYKNQVSFIERFHKDFAKIVRAYAGDRKVFIFIDDVDRCEVPKAADLMQSLNLLIANDPRLIFIIGMDREKVAAGLAVKFKELLPYLSGSEDNRGESRVVTKSPLLGLEYGYNFIEKFIQIPFLIPRPDEKNLRILLDQIGTRSLAAKSPAEVEPIKTEGPTDKAEPEVEDHIDAEHEREDNGSPKKSKGVDEKGPGEDVEAKAKRAEARVAFDRDFDRIRDIVLKVNPALESNPRRVKQFINLFRLRAYIAIETGFIDLNERAPSIKDWTFEKLGKLVAISLRWPLLLAELDKDPTILMELEQSAWRPAVRERLMKAAGSNLTHWAGKADMRELLRAGCFDENGKADTEGRKLYSIGELDLDKLLLVSPRVRTLADQVYATEEQKPEKGTAVKEAEDTREHEESREIKSVKKAKKKVAKKPSKKVVKKKAPKKKEVPAKTITKKKAKRKTAKKKATKKKLKKKLK